jgi:transcriptional regulator with XRE-family HTH domain
MSDDVDRILTEFMQAWEAGGTPEPDDYLDRVPPERQAELSEQLRTYLMVAPEPDYDAGTWDRLAASPAVTRAMEIPLAGPEPWPALLPRLRERAGVGWADVAQRLGVRSPDKAQGYLEAMERGEHDPRRVTRRALDALARILGVPADALAWTGPGGATPAGVVLRSSAPATADLDTLSTLADLAATDADDWDDSDDLFLGGRDA